MKARHLLGMAALTVVTLAAFNVVVAKLSVNLPVHYLGRKLSTPPRVDFLFVGDSTMDSALDTQKFSREWVGQTTQPVAALNAALRASTPVEHYLVTRRALQERTDIRWVVYGFWGLILTEPPSTSWTNQVGNKTLGFHYEPDLAAELYAPGSFLMKWRFHTLGHLPMIAERHNLWIKVEQARRQCEELGMPPPLNSPMGRVADMEAATVQFFTSFVPRCEAAVGDRVPLGEAPARLLRLAHERGARTVIVSMPMNEQLHRFYFSKPVWQKYHDHLRTLVENEGAVFVNASAWMESKYFYDTRHLTKQGAQLFSEKLAAHLADLARRDPKPGI